MSKPNGRRDAVDEVMVDDKDNLIINDGEQNFEQQYKFDNFENPEMISYDRPPTPPLASVNPNVLNSEILDVEAETWGEGADPKWIAY